MVYDNRHTVIPFILLGSMIVLSFYKEPKPGYDSVINENQFATDTASPPCNAGLWKHVYNPSRLQVIRDCIAVSGIITESHAEADGDQHLLLKPDAGYEGLLTKKNLKSKKGNLVIEAVCVNNVTDKKVGNACKGYVNNVKLPAIGAHVKVSGTLVLDTHNGWNEIHPVTKIESHK